jgi:hypothetical protein
VPLLAKTRFVATVPAKLLRTLDRFSANVHSIPPIEVSPISFHRTAGMCDLFRDKPVLRLQNQLYRLSSVRNDLHIAEFFEPIFAEFNAHP